MANKIWVNLTISTTNKRRKLEEVIRVWPAFQRISKARKIQVLGLFMKWAGEELQNLVGKNEKQKPQKSK